MSQQGYPSRGIAIDLCRKKQQQQDKESRAVFTQSECLRGVSVTACRDNVLFVVVVVCVVVFIAACPGFLNVRPNVVCKCVRVTGG